MAIAGISDAMKQYSKATEEIMRNREGARQGVKLPDSHVLVAAFAAIFFILVLVGELMA